MVTEHSSGVAVSPAAERFLAGLRDGIAAVGCRSLPLVVGVSGGADSVALLLGLLRLLPGSARSIVVAHAEHDLRSIAAEDRGFVVSLAARLRVGFSWRRLAVRDDRTGRGEGLEGRARRLRYAFFVDVAREVGARQVAVAHTSDDQAETILHRVLRGTGVGGLAGMRPARELCEGVGLVRPLLGVSRSDARGFLAHHQETWREDASNTDTSRARNFLRHELLPRCGGHYPAAVAALGRLGRHAAMLADALASAADQILAAHARRHADGSVMVAARDLAGLDAHLLGAVFVALWRREGWSQRDMSEGHYGRLAALVAGRCPGSFSLPGGVQARMVPAGWLELRPDSGESPSQDDISTLR